MKQRATFQVFLASPGDLIPERSLAVDVVAEMNAALRDSPLSIDLRGWEATLPGVGRPQALINPDVDTCDLFVGMLWKRWGQSTGTHDSGFSEEVERALRRHKATGAPDVWVFFKDLDAESLADPGPQLTKVIAFRKTAERERKFLFQTFATTEKWGSVFREALLRTVFNRTMARPSTVEGTVSPPAATTRQGQEQFLPDVQEAMEVLGSVSEHGVDGALVLPGDSRARMVARLHLVSSALSDSMFGESDLRTHDLNALYVHRGKVEPLDPLERLAILRTVLSPTEVNPGFFFLWRDDLDVWRSALVFMAKRVTDPRLIPAAIRLLDTLGGKPREARAFRDWCLAHDDSAVKKAALAWIARTGDSEDVSAIEQSSAYGDAGVGVAATCAAVEVAARVDPSAAFEKALSSTLDLEADAAKILAASDAPLSDEQENRLRKHSSAVLRLAGLRRLSRRGDEAVDAIQLARTDADRSVRRFAFEEGIKRGIPTTVDQIQKAFGEGLHLFDEDAPALFRQLMATMAAPDLNRHIRVLSWGGPQAYLSLGLLPGMQDAVRADLRDGAAGLRTRLLEAERAESQASHDLLVAKHDSLIKHAMADYVQAAIEILLVQGRRNDLALIEPFLDAEESKTRFLALRAFEALGGSEHAARVLRLLADASDSIASEAVRAAFSLAVDKSDVTRAILRSGKRDVLETLLAVLAEHDAEEAKRVARTLMKHEDQDLRKVAVAVFANAKDDELLNLLDEYTAGAPYYYNVPTLLDRLLFAPAPVKAELRLELSGALTGHLKSPIPSW